MDQKNPTRSTLAKPSVRAHQTPNVMYDVLLLVVSKDSLLQLFEVET